MNPVCFCLARQLTACVCVCVWASGWVSELWARYVVSACVCVAAAGFLVTFEYYPTETRTIHKSTYVYDYFIFIYYVNNIHTRLCVYMCAASELTVAHYVCLCTSQRWERSGTGWRARDVAPHKREYHFVWSDWRTVLAHITRLRIGINHVQTNEHKTHIHFILMIAGVHELTVRQKCLSHYWVVKFTAIKMVAPMRKSWLPAALAGGCDVDPIQ